MDKSNFFEKAKVSAEILSARTGERAVKAADAAGKTAAGMLSATKLNLQILDLNTEIEILYKEIGRMVYHVHTGESEDQEALQVKFQLIDEKLEKIEALREQLEAEKSAPICPNCGKSCRREDTFCSSCGAQL